MPITLPTPLILRTITAHAWRVASVRYENLADNHAALCVWDLEFIDADGRVVEVRQVRGPMAELVARHPELYASMKTTNYSEVGAYYLQQYGEELPGGVLE